MLRVGIGYDVHRFVKGRRLVLGGVEIPFGEGLDGHSDADVLVHAVIDALLGAAALGDIGTHFPPSYEKYRDVDSLNQLLPQVVDLLSQHDWVVGNIDCVVVADRPKIAKYIPQIREGISRICKIEENCVGVKATTEEGIGLAGHGIGAHVVCTILVKGGVFLSK